MTLSNEEIKIFFFRFLNNEIGFKDFEAWIYATPELEPYLGADAYFEFLLFNFNQIAAAYEFKKIINKYITPVEFYNWQIKHLLESLLDDTLDPVDVFESLYDLAYHKGYYFLSDLAIQYVLWIDKIPGRSTQHLWDEKVYEHLRAPLEKYLQIARQEIKFLLTALDSGDIKILHAGEHGFETKYQIETKVNEDLKLINEQIWELNTQNNSIVKAPVKKWWQFWK